MITILKDEEFRTAIVNAIDGADREILISTYKFSRSSGRCSGEMDKVYFALGRAILKGVRVLLLLNVDDKNSSIGRLNIKSGLLLKKMGAKVVSLPEGRTCHAKIIIVDNMVAFVGSHNLSESSLCRNFEISLMIVPQSPPGHGPGYDDEVIQNLRRLYLEEWRKGR